jgi:hypothetical protein
MINPDEYFSKGSSGNEMTSQAVAEINRARDAGLTVEADRLESNLKAAIITLQNSGGKDTNGFTTMIKSIGELAPQVNSVIQEKSKFQNTAKALENALALSMEIKNPIAPETMARLDAARQSEDAVAIESILKYIDDTNKSTQEKNAKIAEEQGKAEIAIKQPPKKTTGDISFEQNSSAALRYADELMDTIKTYGTSETYNSKGAAKLAQLPYQMAIAYAKTVDPTSVAREGEVDAAKKYLIPTGMFTRNETALAAASEFKKDILERIKQYNTSTGSNIETPENKTPEKKNENAPITKVRPPLKGLDRGNQVTPSNNQEEVTPEEKNKGANDYFNSIKQ